MSEAENQIEVTEAKNEPTVECRACLQILNADCVLYNIFDCWTPPWDGMENSIAEDLAKIANIQISESDRHSKIICETCCQLLLSACSFAAVVKKNDEILQQRYGEDKAGPNLSNDRVWPKPIQVDKSIANSMYENVDIKQEILSDEEHEYPTANGPYNTSTDDIPNLDIIKIEPEEIIQQQPLQMHVTVNGNEESDNLSTKETHLTNGNSDNEEHLISEIKEEPLSDEDDTDIQSDLPLECLLCAKPFNSVSGLKAHVIAQHSYKSVKRKRVNSLSPEKKECKYICAICRRTFTTSTDVMVHETCHNKSVCYGCNESFDTFDQLTVHRRTCKAIASKEVTKLKTLDDVLSPVTEMDNTTVLCTVCDKPLHNGNSIRTVHTKGLTTFIKNSKAREDNKWKLWDGKLSYEFHESCVKAYSRSRLAFRPRKNPKLKQSPELDVPPFSSSTLSPSFSDIDPMILTHSDFDFKNLCLFCGKNWDRAHKVGHVVRNGYLRDRILEIADRNNTDIALILKQRLRGADLVAVEARYHKKCYDSFINPPTAAQKIYVLY